MIALIALSLSTLQSVVKIDILADKPATPVSPSLYGIFFEEINQAGEGGLYAEMLRDRGLEGPAPSGLPNGWEPAPSGGTGSATLVDETPLNDAHQHSIKLVSDGKFGIENDGFWGIDAKKDATYRLTMWVKGDTPISARLISSRSYGDPAPFAESSFAAPGDGWKRIETTLKPSESDVKSKLTIVPTKPGTLWIAYASLMPTDTWKKRPNGMRIDLAQEVANMHPKFVRFPGGCYVEGGDHLANAFDWKRSVEPEIERKGLDHSMWGYPNSFGLGYHEYLQWCEDLGAAPLFVVNCGMCHREITPMPDMDQWVQNALDAIEYANGPTSTKWGALRAKNGHPKPFGLRYIEIGNENGASWSFGGPPPYAERYTLIYDAIKKAHPEIVCIADNPVPHQMEFVDEHYYADPDFFWRNSTRYDSYDRKGPRIYVGEYAVTQGCGQGNLAAALGEAAFMTGMERNSDIVRMSSYAPLFVNVNNRQWNPNAIVFDNARCFGTPSYFVQAMFSQNRADRVLKYTVDAPTGPGPGIAGGIGLGTWRTPAEFKDVALTVDGKPVYSSDGIKTGDLTQTRGDWKVESGVISQSSNDQGRRAILTGAKVDGAQSYTLTLKARKISGPEGFMIILDSHDGTDLTWNVGGWNNSQTAFQRTGAVLEPAVHEPKIETGRWYDVKIEREGTRVRGYLDGKLIQEVVETGVPNFAAVAGIDDEVHELVIKAVNGSSEARTAKLNIAGVHLGDNGKAIVLTGPDLMAENSFDDTRKIAPVTSGFNGLANGEYTFKPLSVTILRIPIRDMLLTSRNGAGRSGAHKR